MLIIAGIFGVCEFAAAIAILSGGSAGTTASLNLYRAINFLSLPAAYNGMGLFTVLMLASDMSKEMKLLALSDALTGVMNRRGFTDAASRAVSASHRKGAPLSAIVCDIDHFKSINDRYGHARGDAALRKFTEHLQHNARPQDAIGRLGGEEFAVLLPDTPLAVAITIAERLHASLSTLVIETGAAPIQIQASFGVAELHGKDDDITRLIERADGALYRSKREGRDRVTVA
jgi:diguanylate cyclase (GGDEF)-like protein